MIALSNKWYDKIAVMNIYIYIYIYIYLKLVSELFAPTEYLYIF